MDAGQRIGDGVADERPLSRCSMQQCAQPGRCPGIVAIGDPILFRYRAAVAADRDPGQAGSATDKFFGVDAQLPQGPGPRGLDDDVGPVDQAQQLSAALGGSGIERNALLALIQQRSEEHTSELQSLMRISYAGFCLKKKKQ